MTSKKKRQRRRKNRQNRRRNVVARFDVHAQHLMDSVESLEALMKKFAAMDDPVVAMADAFDEAIAQFVEDVRNFDPHRLIEVARMTYLPRARPGEVAPTAEATAAHVELLALIALAAANERSSGDTRTAVEVQEMSHFVSKAAERLNALTELSQLRAIAAADPTDRMATIALLLRGIQVFVRHTSYAELVEETVVQLIDGDAAVRTAVRAQLGFNAADALTVLNACHDVQEAKFNARGQELADVMNDLTRARDESPDEKRTAFETAIVGLFEPDVDGSTVSVGEVVAQSGIPEDRVRAVIEQFRLDLGSATPAQVVEEFMSGGNPMRTHPLVVSATGRLMLPHNVLTVNAVKENLEQQLKNMPAWNAYSKHRGELLESRMRVALERVLPGAVYRDGFEYYLPANDAELAAAEPLKYTKRVEGDHLVVLDDVALIVEDKAVALSALSKGGKTQRIRTDLTGIVKKAADQAGRLRDAIERDGGVRVEGEGWVDLSHVREIHTMAVSLDDLMGITTATAELVRAGFLHVDNIPWTVSLHDFELITELVERPAEFLLFLRRRLSANTTVMFSAADELDLFLYFFEDGLWVEPDPDQVRNVFEWMDEPAPGERRRFRAQVPVYVTSRTDALDAWYHAKRTPGATPVPKPSMVASPLADLIDELQARSVFGWLSIGATLLEPASGMQHKLARHPDELLGAPAANGVGRSLTVPMAATTNRAEAWLMVWATHPVGSDLVAAEKELRDYLRAKKDQLSIPRGVVFLYDEGTRHLVDVYYDGYIGKLPADLSEKLVRLRAPTEFHGRLHPNAKRSPKGKPKPKRRK